MKYWWSLIVKDYFTFSKRERTGTIITMIVVVAALFLIPKIFHPPVTKIDRTALIKQIAELKITVDSSNSYKSYSRDNNENIDFYQPKNTFTKEIKGELFEWFEWFGLLHLNVSTHLQIKCSDQTQKVHL